jgi:hypothetical protein
MNLKKVSVAVSALIIIFLLFVQINSANSQAQFKLAITATNSTSSSTVNIGWDRTATHCVDALLGEMELPPKPPSEIFDARLLDNRTPSCLGEGLTTDLRLWSSTAVSDTFVITVQPGAGGVPITLTWSPVTDPQIGTLVIQDGFGGIFINVDMKTAGTATISNALLTTLNIYATNVINDVKVENQLPTSFGLEQNYPNPFNPTTNVKFSIPEKSNVEIVVFDMLGKKVRTLVSENLSANVYSIEWNGRSDNDVALASGIYNIRMIATSELGKSFTDVRKVVLMK